MNYKMVQNMKRLASFLIFFQIAALMPVFAETDAATDPEKPTQIEIQQALTAAGFYKGKIDGVIGAQTRAAVRNFQEKNDLTVDGKIGPKTWEKLKPYLGTDETDQTSAAPASEETSEYSMTLEQENHEQPDPAASTTDSELKQKLVS